MENETSPPKVSASGSGSGRAVGRGADREGTSLSDADSAVHFPYLISLGKIADLSNRESGFDSFRSGLFSPVLVEPLAVFRAQPLIEFVLVDALGQSDVARVLEEPHAVKPIGIAAAEAEAVLHR